MLILKSAIYYFFLWITIAVFACAVIVTAVFPFRVRYAVVPLWPRSLLWLLKVLCGLNYEVEGLDNLPEGEPAIVMAKHQSTWETFAFFQFFPMLTWVVKKELLWTPFFGQTLALLKPIALDRSKGRKALEQLVEKGKATLDAGRWIVIFPEGTRIPKGKKGRYKLGGAYLASKTGRPIVPVAHNAGSFWKKRGIIYPGTVRVVIGPVIESKGRSPEELIKETESWIESKMQELEGRSEPAELYKPR